MEAEDKQNTDKRGSHSNSAFLHKKIFKKCETSYVPFLAW